MTTGTRAFNALNGAELKAKILKELAQDFELDPRFSRADRLERLTMVFRLRVEAYPMDPPFFTVQVSRNWVAAPNALIHEVPGMVVGAVKANLDADERFSLHLTYPKVTWDWRIEVEPTTRVEEALSPKTAPAVVDPIRRKIDLTEAVAEVPMAAVRTVSSIMPDRVTLPQMPVVSESGFIVDAQGRKFRMVPVEDPVVDTPMTGATISPAELRHNRLDKYTESGLEIEVGFKPSPGAALAASFGKGSPVGAMQTETVEFGRSHPTLDEGGAGAPDAIRREAGLAVPQTQASAGGGIVDLPAGSF